MALRASDANTATRDDSMLPRGIAFSTPFSTGSEAGYPASAVTASSDSVLCHGWRSPRDCPYPQELLLEFPQRYTVTQLQVLVHEYMIASKVELFIGDRPGPMGSIDIRSCPFHRLGFLSLDSNEKSQFTVRELKSVYLQTVGSFMRLRFHECHTNELNQFNQVGIVAIMVLGLPYGDVLPSHSVSPLLPHAGDGRHMVGDNDVDEEIAMLINGLSKLKAEAVDREDYDNAQRYKMLIDQHSQVVHEVRRLEGLKRRAVEQEDYDVAKELKSRISNMKAELRATVADERQGSPNEPRMPSSGSSFYPNVDNRSSGARVAEVSVSRQSVVAIDAPVSNDERSIHQASAATPSSVIISAADEKDAVMVATIFGDFTVQCLFNTDRNLRETAVKEVHRLLPEILRRCGLPSTHASASSNDSQVLAIFHATCRLITRALQDKISQVSQSVMLLIEFIVSEQVGVISELRPSDIHSSFDPIIKLLIDKLGDSNGRVTRAANHSLLTLASSNAIGAEAIVKPIIKKGVSPSGRHLLERVHLISAILDASMTLSTDFLTELLSFIREFFSHASSDVRGACVQVAVQIFRFSKSETLIESTLSGLKPALVEAIRNALSHDVSDPSAAITTYQHSSWTDQGRRNSDISQVDDKETALPVTAAVENEGDNATDTSLTCQFCGLNNGLYSSEDLDYHFWRNCALLCACAECGQVVEIPSLTEHMVSECVEGRQRYVRCAVCEEAVLQDGMDTHRLTCHPVAPACVRCPLCLVDISVMGEGWRTHLLPSASSQPCSNNFRTKLNFIKDLQR